MRRRCAVLGLSYLEHAIAPSLPHHRSDLRAGTAKFVALFEWDFDFSADSLPGDEFRILVEKRFAADRFVSYGAIVAAEYRSADRPPLSVVRILRQRRVTPLL